MLKSLQYIHSLNIIHRDIKPENFLFILNNNEGEVMKLKLIDFGMCEKKENIKLSSIWVGTMYYQSPEMLNQFEYNEKIDLWGIGVILYLLIYKKLPFKNKRNNRMIIHQKIRTKELQFKSSRINKDKQQQSIEEGNNNNLDSNNNIEDNEVDVEQLELLIILLRKLLVRDFSMRLSSEEALQFLNS
jgi:serine/threonine protein kinase